MRRLFTFLLLVFCGWTSAVAADGLRQRAKAPSLENTRLCGIMIYDNDKNVETFGHYSYTVTNPIQRKALQLIRAISAEGGAIVKDGKLYVYDYAVDYGYVSKSRYYCYNLATGEAESQKNVTYDTDVAYHHAAMSAATDPSDGTVYCCTFHYNNDTKELSYKLSTWNLEAMTKDNIADLQAPLRVMACAADGTLYGITASTSATGNNGGMLVKIDKKDGSLTKIGDTGVRPKYHQSAVIDTATGTFYWFANEEDEAANLYTVNLLTGAATKIGALPNGDQVVGAYVPQPEAADGAPSAAKALSLSFADGQLSGTVSFDMPSTTYSGAALSGDINYTIYAGETVLATGSATAGSHVNQAVTIAADGKYTVKVVLSNGIGNSPATELSQYIGYDVPLAPGSVTLTRTDKLNTLSWTAPTGTVNGGYMNATGLKYQIVRMPGSVVIADAHTGTEFSETYDAEELGLCYYKVSAINGSHMGDATTSNTVTVGSALKPPYSQDFTEETSTGLYTIVDANADSKTWAYYRGAVRYSTSYAKAADDWLILPPLKLEAGSSYNLSYKVYGGNARYTNKLTVMTGNDATVAAMNTTVKEETAYSNTSSTATVETVTLKPDADGIYYIGFHLTSDASQGFFYIDNIEVSAGISTEVPAAVTNLTVEPGAEGALKADISFVSPAQTAGGNKLEDLTTIEILRNGTVVKTITPTSAEAKTYTYTDEPTTSGTYTYAVQCVNSKGTGEAAEIKAYVGIDMPEAPATVELAQQTDGKALLTWSAVASIGPDGGYVDPAAVTYNIYDAMGLSVVKGLNALQYVPDVDMTGAQKELKYSVEAVNATGKSATKTASNTILAGKSYAVPYTEGFASAAITNGPWINETLSGKSYDSKWSPRTDQDYNGDGGSADFQGFSVGAISRYAGPKVDISSVEHPYLTFQSLMPTGGVKITVSVSLNDGKWQQVAELENTTVWTRQSVDLSAYRSANLRVAFTGECTKGYNYCYIDDINIDGVTKNEVALTDIEGPAFVNAGADATYTVGLLNSGATDAGKITVNLADTDDNIIATAELDNLTAQQTGSVNVTANFNASHAGKTLTLHAVIKATTDTDMDNNRSQDITTRIMDNAYAVPTNLTAKGNTSAVALEWTTPEVNTANAVNVVETFENYEPFGVTGFGKWTVADQDKAATYVFGETSSYPNAGKPQAFTVFDTKSKYFSTLNLETLFGMDRTHGNKLAVCWASAPADTPDGHNDDWLISPVLAAGGGKVTFAARSYSDKYTLESFEVYTSTTGNAVTDFTNKIGSETGVSAAGWTDFEYTVPADAKYFAIRCVTANGFMLCIDNIEYKPEPTPAEGLTLAGYNIYRNGELLGQSTMPTYTDVDPLAGLATYNVSAVYNLGESQLSAPATVDTTSGIGSINGGLTVNTNGGLSINGTNGASVSVYTASGALVISHKGDIDRLPLSQGMYIIKIGSNNMKVVIK